MTLNQMTSSACRSPFESNRSRAEWVNAVPPLFMHQRAGVDVHDPPESLFTIDWNLCSRPNGISVHDPPESADTQSTPALKRQCGDSQPLRDGRRA